MSKCFLFTLPRNPLRRLGSVASLVLILSLCDPARGETITGAVLAVRDVDTIVVNQTPIRLSGVDGPERTTPQGQRAQRWMTDFLRGKKLRCVLDDSRSYDRRIGICYTRQQDIGAAAIEAGQALDCPRFSNGRYSHLETARARASLARAPYC